MVDKKYRSYKRGHDFEFPAEAELGKIKKEKHNFEKLEKKSEKQMYRIVQKASSKFDFFEELEEELEDYELASYKATKEKRNAKVHKNRYKDFNTYPDFD